MNDNTPSHFTNLVSAGRREVVTPTRPFPYISHEQAVRLYGDPINGSTCDPGSILGALFNIEGALLEANNKLGSDKDDPQSLSNQDFGKIIRLGETLHALTAHARDKGWHFHRPRTGLALLKGDESVPIAMAETLLPEGKDRIHSIHSASDPAAHTARVLEIQWFFDRVADAVEIAQRYQKDGHLSQKQCTEMMDRLRNALHVSGLSEGIAGLLPETTARPDTAASLINTTPSQIQRG